MKFTIQKMQQIIAAWEDIPWFRAVTIIGTTIGGLIFLNTSLPEEISIDLSALDPTINRGLLVFILVLYFFLVSIFSGDRLRFEKKLRELEQNFKYDNRGTLYNGTEPNIAFRIETFKGMLDGLSNSIGTTEFAKLITETGRHAGEDFSKSLKKIYDLDVASKKATSSWDELNLKEKFNQWAEYDSATGWGILACTMKGEKVKVIINHLTGLFDDNGGLMFGHFVGGYSETIIKSIISGHVGGKFTDFNNAVLTKTHQSDKYTLELEFDLK